MTANAITLDAASCYAALHAHDARFDGVFYVGVKTTGIYCRPICPARTPARDRCEFFAAAAEAERAGYRACFRCRPELAPGHAAVDARSRLARAASAKIEAGFLNDHSLEELGELLGVSSRHLRRVLDAELGISAVELAQTRRLALAKQLLHDTTLSIADVAFASGFASVRRFNALFRERFARPPSALRQHGAVSQMASAAIVLRLDYRPPFAWEALLDFLGARAIPGVELVTAGEYRRTVVLDEYVGWVVVGAAAGRSALCARVAPSLAARLMEVAARLRALFDLDARPDLIASHLRCDAALEARVAARPGLRVPGAFDGFELAIRAVLGQQVSVGAATTMAGRLVEGFGRAAGGSLAGSPEGPAPEGLDAPEGLGRCFPTATRLAAAASAQIRAIGLPAARAQSIVELSRLVAERRLDLSVGADPEQTLAALQRIDGIGPWTAHYIALRALRWPDAFPAGDLGVKKALAVTTGREAERRASSWRPWRAYGVMHLWQTPQTPATGQAVRGGR